ncbi:molybdate ABC transporter substrate-binding protein [Arenimonas soli]|uniref:Molybdate ABC transporter substrate-binding protein n=1 Tax=Arenimonas soli TaxID=2269504 RepID=A0ABQ1HCR6_9GAMM|nr:molybdate ABC transporter substrate-binding protein [Arenimonas soli]GGA69877.1 molybdate ABC transporter substrate-binding protein [Arenimonas soli]
MKSWWLLILLALPAPGLASGRAGDELLVFAAASLQEAMDDAGAAWQARSGQRVRVSYAGSAALARQLERGAPVDVFVSADAAWMDYLQARGLVDPASRFDLAGNALVLVAPRDRPAAVALEPAALLAALGPRGRLVLADTGSVPAGRYARQSLRTLGLWQALHGRRAETDSVRAALSFVARGEAPLGIVYATDARVEPRVVVVARLPAGSHDAVRYPVARAGMAPAARSAGFLAFLRGDEMRDALRARGFMVP